MGSSFTGRCEALRRVDPRIREAVLKAMRRSEPRFESAPSDVEAQVFPTCLSLAMVYIPGGAHARLIHVVTRDHDMVQPG